MDQRYANATITYRMSFGLARLDEETTAAVREADEVRELQEIVEDLEPRATEYLTASSAM